jgi:outer membrane protein OmpA-like peptidoglycan-associated protein
MLAYIFSSRYLNVCIFGLSFAASPSGAKPFQANPTTTAPRALCCNSRVSRQQPHGGIRIGGRMSAGAGISAIGENPPGVGSEAAATPTKGRDQTRAYRHFLKRSLLFEPNSVGLALESEKRVALDAVWLRMHPEVRTVVVGFCDTLGSEECTHELAQRRGAVVGQLLVKYGVGSSQIVAVKGWEKADPVCGAETPSCQEMNRRARIFIAGFGPLH